MSVAIAMNRWFAAVALTGAPSARMISCASRPVDSAAMSTIPQPAEVVLRAVVIDHRPRQRRRLQPVAEVAQLVPRPGVEHHHAVAVGELRGLEVLDHLAVRVEELVPRRQLAGDGDPRVLADRGERVVQGQLCAQSIRVRANVGHQQRAVVLAEKLN